MWVPPQWSNDGLRNSEFEIIDSCDSLNKYCSLRPPQGHQELSTTEPFLLPYVDHVWSTFKLLMFHLSLRKYLNSKCHLVNYYWYYTLNWGISGFWKINTDLFVETSVKTSEFFLSFVSLTDFFMKDRILICVSGCPWTDCIA